MHILKKYPNRRIYDTGNSCYITLADVRRMVMERKPFQVLDSKSGEDITRGVLLQVIAEMEAEGHQSLLTNRVLEELIRFYGDKLVGLLGPFLERQVVGFLTQQDNLREHLRGLSTGKLPLPVPSPDQLIDTLTQQYQQLLKPFVAKGRKDRGAGESAPAPGERADVAGSRRARGKPASGRKTRGKPAGDKGEPRGG